MLLMKLQEVNSSPVPNKTNLKFINHVNQTTMKKATVLIMLLISISIANAQSYFTLGATGKGASMGIGRVFKHRVDVSVLYDTPFESVSGSRSLGINLGYQINLTGYGEEDLTFLPTIGLTNLRTRVYRQETNEGGQKSETMTGKFSTLYLVPGFEVGQNVANGRVSLVYKHIEKNYYGLSIRVFLDKIFKKGGFRENFL